MNMKSIVDSKIGHLQYGLLEDAAQREKNIDLQMLISSKVSREPLLLP
jgi:hypothetical protein